MCRPCGGGLETTGEAPRLSRGQRTVGVMAACTCVEPLASSPGSEGKVRTLGSQPWHGARAGEVTHSCTVQTKASPW